MKITIKKVLTSIALYIVQVGAFWGLLEGFTYFTGDALKTFLGAYWIAIYIVPFFTTTVCILFFKGNETGGPGGDAEVIGDGEARGGKGGNSGTFGSGGKGGNARVVGAGKAKGGGGGNG